MRVTLSGAWVALGLGVGCQTTDQDARCLAERQAARSEALADDYEAAEKRLSWVQRVCGANSMSDVQRIRRQILARQEAKRLRAIDAASKAAGLRGGNVEAFLAWATEGSQERSAGVEVTCFGRGTAEYGFCTGHNSLSTRMRLRFWKSEPDAVRYTLVTPEAIVCEDLGPHRLVRRWEEDGIVRERCELTSRKLRNLEALVERREEANTPTTVDIYSLQYLDRDVAFGRQLQRSLPKLEGIIERP